MEHHQPAPGMEITAWGRNRLLYKAPMGNQTKWGNTDDQKPWKKRNFRGGEKEKKGKTGPLKAKRSNDIGISYGKL